MADARLAEMLDKDEIREVLLRYCRAVDRSDEELLRSVYHPDSYDDHGMFRGSGPEFIDWLMERSRTTKTVTQHTIPNVLIDLDRDSAFVETYVLAYHIRDDERGRRLEILGGRYLDQFERREGQWRIAHRTLVHDWSQVETEDPGFPNREKMAAGCRGPSDPSYTLAGGMPFV